MAKEDGWKDSVEECITWITYPDDRKQIIKAPLIQKWRAGKEVLRPHFSTRCAYRLEDIVKAYHAATKGL